MLGGVKILKEVMLSKYVYKLELKNGNVLLYNSLNKCLVEVEHLEAIDREDFNDTAVSKYLEANYFLVKDQKDSENLLHEYLLKSQYSNDVLTFAIHTNYNCNLKCTYCYQKVIETDYQMNDNTVKNVLKFITAKYRIEKPMILDISIIGGEPLLDYERVKKILHGLQLISCRFKKVSIITNGVFLTLEKYEELIKLGVTAFQITIDGKKDTHDLKRVGKDGRGSFDIIIQNLQIICRKYKKNSIIINYNLDIDTYKSIYDFFTYLRESRINCQVIFSEVFDTKGEFSGKEVIANSQIWFKAHKIAIDFGQRYAPFYRMSYMTCGMKKVNNFMISPRGELYKCISGMEDKKYLIGEMNEYGDHNSMVNMSKFIESENREECMQCKYFPVCGGGCIYRNIEKGFKCYKDEIEYNDLPVIKYQYEKDYVI